MSQDFDGRTPTSQQPSGQGEPPRIALPPNANPPKSVQDEPPRIAREGRPPTTRDGRPATVHDGRPSTVRDDRRSTVRDDRSGAPSTPVPDADSRSAIPFPDDLARDYDIADELVGGGEADVAVIKHRETGQQKVMKVYRSGITLPQSISDTLEVADQAHVLPVRRYIYHGWRSPRVIELMDYLPEGSLEDLLENSGGSAPQLARDILDEVTKALDHIHNTMHLVHRDIKPANILISRREPLDLVLADLGLAAQLADIRISRRDTTGGVKGTLVYQSPETLNMSDAGAPRDWWALGMTMCEVLTGQHPFKDSHGNVLRDQNQIRHAITMGTIDLSMIRDERWNLLCRGLLVHDPKDRWTETQVRAWLAGETPPVAAARPQQAGPQHTVRPYRFAGRRFTDPVELATYMVQNWDDAAKLFTSAEECTTLRAWIREEVKDNTIEVNVLTPVPSSDPSQIDVRIIEFTSHYRGSDDLVFRGTPITAVDLAARYLRAGDNWENDPLLSALTSRVVSALAETQLDEGSGPQGQSDEYHALAQLARYTRAVDKATKEAVLQISTAASDRVEGVDVGTTVRDGLPLREVRARAMARAALLSQRCLADVRTDFSRLNTAAPPWFATLATKARGGTQPSAPKIARPRVETPADASSIALMALAIGVKDLAAHYQNASLKAQAAAEQQRREEAAAAAAAEIERQRQLHAEAAAAAAAEAKAERTDQLVKTLMAGGVLIACFAAIFLDRWLLKTLNPREDWPVSWAYAILNWPSAQFQLGALVIGIVASMAISILINALPELRPHRDTMVFSLLGYGGLCLLPLVGVLLCFLVMIAIAIIILGVIAAISIAALTN